MTKPHWKPVNVKLTGNSASRVKQSLGSVYQESRFGETDWMTNEGLEASRRALNVMIANGWTGYGSKRKPRPRKLKAHEVQHWIRENRKVAAAMLAGLTGETVGGYLS